MSCQLLSCPNYSLHTKDTYQYASTPPGMSSSHAVYDTAQTRESKTTKEMEADIQKVDEEISRLQTALDHLTAVRQRMKRSLNERTTPIYRIPTEILSEIFLHCLVEDSDGFDAEEAPLLLSFVCSKWRTVAISTPQLWSSISLDSPPRGGIEMLETWLSRSSASPLKIICSQGSPDDSATLNAIIPHSHRWRDVKFILDSSQSTFLASVKGHLPMLETLQLGLWDSFSTPPDFFEVAPRLHTVMLLYMTPGKCLLPWQQLRTCNVRMSPMSGCFYILQQCTNLIHCTFEYIDKDDIPDTSTALWIRPQLRSLCLLLGQQIDVSHLLDNFVFPALRDLEIGLDEIALESFIFIQDRLSSCFARSSCNLHRLCLRDIAVTDNELITCLQGLPSLTILEVQELLDMQQGNPSPMVTAPLLRRMTHDVFGSCVLGSPLLVPSLKRLNFRAHFDLDDQIILDMVQSRWKHDIQSEGTNPVATLEWVRLTCWRFDQRLVPSALEKVTSWQAEGLDIEVTS